MIDGGLVIHGRFQHRCLMIFADLHPAVFSFTSLQECLNYEDLWNKVVETTKGEDRMAAMISHGTGEAGEALEV